MTTPKEQGKDDKDGKVSFFKMTLGGKLIFLGKFVVFLASFGFAFPTLFSD